MLRELKEFEFREFAFLISRKAQDMLKKANIWKSKVIAIKMEAHQVNQHFLIYQLKQQLEYLERYAYETGEVEMLLQTAIIECQ